MQTKTGGVLISSVFLIAALVFLAFSSSASAELTFPSIAGLDPGDRVKTAEDSAVYYIGNDERRYRIPDEQTYYTWYERFSGIDIITPEEMGAIPLGGVVTYKPYERLIKQDGVSTVYAVMEHGNIIPIRSQAGAEDHFGLDWPGLVDTIPNMLWGTYTITNGNLGPGDKWDPELSKNYKILDDLKAKSVAGVMLYEDPNRFAATDESGDCEEDSCQHNIVTVEQGGTLKFANFTSETVTVREEMNLWTTGPMSPEDIKIVPITWELGEYYFYADEDPDMYGQLIITE